MTIDKNTAGNEITLVLTGRLDSVTSPQLEEEVNAIPADITSLTLDLENLEYLSSAGLRVILAAQKKMNKVGRMTVTGVNTTIMEVFEITGFSDILTFV